jgi:hypothetical protein
MAFVEFNTSPTVQGDGKTMTMTRTGTILGSEILSMQTGLFPAAIGGIAQLPAAAPGSFSFLRAKSFSCKPLGPDPLIASCGASQLNTYALYEAEITYGVLEEDHGNGTDEDGETGGDPNSDQIATIRRSVGGEYMTIPNRNLQWEDDESKLQGEDISAGKMIPTIELIITIHRSSTNPAAAMRALVGKVNNATYMGAGEETLLYIGGDVTREITTESPQPYRVEHRFVERAVDGGIYGWNHLYDPTSGTWRKVETSAGQPLYLKTDFGGLL